MAIGKNDTFDFLIDIVPRDDSKTKRSDVYIYLCTKHVKIYLGGRLPPSNGLRKLFLFQSNRNFQCAYGRTFKIIFIFKYIVGKSTRTSSFAISAATGIAYRLNF